MSKLTERIRIHKEDRALMADLRCALVESKKHRAWPALFRLGLEVSDEVAAFVAGLHAQEPEDASANGTRACFGRACKIYETRRGESRGEDQKITPTERRFQAVLVAEPGPELHARVLRLARMIQREGISIDYDELEFDLRTWNDKIRTKWAAAFWAHGHSGSGEEDPS